MLSPKFQSVAAATSELGPKAGFQRAAAFTQILRMLCRAPAVSD